MSDKLRDSFSSVLELPFKIMGNSSARSQSEQNFNASGPCDTPIKQ